MLEVVAAYTYYGPKGTASGDTKYMKIIVAAIIIVDTLNLAIACLDTYEVFSADLFDHVSTQLLHI